MTFTPLARLSLVSQRGGDLLGGDLAIDLGTAHRGTKRPIRPGLHFRIAGATKSFTAVVVLQLVGEGRLSLGDSVEEWLPGLAPDGARITVRELLAMRSGLSDYLAGRFAVVGTPSECREQIEALEARGVSALIVPAVDRDPDGLLTRLAGAAHGMLDTHR